MRTAFVVLTFLAIASSSAQPQEMSRVPTPEVETVGTGERRVAPDRASVMLVIESKAVSANSAAAANTRSVAAVRDTLSRLGLDTAVTTASYNVGLNYEPTDRGEPRRSGYVARTVLRVRLSRIDQVGRVIDAGLGKGATGVEGIWFESSTAESARRQAMADAAAAARRDAEALAQALGGTLGQLLSVSTVGSPDPRRLNVMMAEVGGVMGRGTEITPNEIVIRAAVQTRWAFVPR